MAEKAIPVAGIRARRSPGIPGRRPAMTLRIRTRLAQRVIYVAKFAEAVYVLHAFEKRSRRIPPVDLAVAKKRWSDLLRQRRDP